MASKSRGLGGAATPPFANTFITVSETVHMGSVFAGAKILEATLRRAFGICRLLIQLLYCGPTIMIIISSSMIRMTWIRVEGVGSSAPSFLSSFLPFLLPLFLLPSFLPLFLSSLAFLLSFRGSPFVPSYLACSFLASFFSLSFLPSLLPLFLPSFLSPGIPSFLPCAVLISVPSYLSSFLACFFFSPSFLPSLLSPAFLPSFLGTPQQKKRTKKNKKTTKIHPPSGFRRRGGTGEEGRLWRRLHRAKKTERQIPQTNKQHIPMEGKS